MNIILSDFRNQNPKNMSILLILSIILCGLVAGLLYGFSCAVNPGLDALDDLKYLSAVQSINEKIQNPVFFISFMGSLIILPICAYLHYQAGHDKWLLLSIAALLYVVGVFGITVFGNIPLNKFLENIDLKSTSANGLADIRLKFQASWIVFHQIRTVSAFFAFILITYTAVGIK